ncbi:adenylate/guanylate cyclase domain-containing protein [Bradyrhizobium sp.]|uniref:ATP-binding protein n=2 Tax=Bradyrhizobium sp. TaxID=376 RepID=UPI001EB1C205|nr:adenylate/guanylate cyclase domain-containing protein [Bradyrhizobium sp.]MBV9983746.1 AAA family ATPase [Bradyrhizobium sp.]
MQIPDWLEKLGLGQYARHFAENDVDLEILRDLTDQDLEKIGVTSLGHRRKLLRAIAELREEVERSVPPAAAAAAAPIWPDQVDSAERRHVTVMFADLVGSTALSARMDPEDLREVISAYQKCVAATVNPFDGFVAKYMGDGVLCYFGWPRAHEDDAERAVRTALAVAKAVAALKTPGGEPLAARVGIATGLVVVGDLVGEGAAQEEAVVGETPNIAARLQGLASPGQVVVAETTRQLLGDNFELADLGRQHLKGIPDPTSAFAVLGERAVESRFEARASDAVSGMVGRDHELALILERWSQAKAGEGQLMLVSGEAGIGKSRLSRSVVDSIARESHLRIKYQCSPYYTDTPLFPVIRHLILSAGITPEDSNDDKLDKLEATLVNGKSDVALIATMIGLQCETRYGQLNLTPQQQRARTLQALVAELIAQSREKSVLFVLEDAHWIDPTTLEFIDLSLDQVVGSRVLILVTARPTFQHGFGGHPIVTRLTLNRLGREPITALVGDLTGGKPLPAALLDEIVAKTDGMPLFVEELTKMLLESGELKETAVAYELTGELSHLDIPASLNASLMARLDRLQPVKEVAQTAACIGREFHYSLLKAVSPLDDAGLQSALERLISAELIFARGRPPEARYVFKHALVCDAAYESLLKRRRQIVHGKLVNALEQQGTAAPEVLAHHASKAGMTGKAIGYWRQAGIAATARPAYQEAIGHLTNALSLVRQGGQDSANLETELDLQVLLAHALIPKSGWSAEPTARAFARALELVERIGGTPNRFPVLFGNWAVQHMRGESAIHLAQSLKILELADQQEDDVARLVALRLAGVSHFAVGNLDAARRDLDLALGLYRPAEHGRLAQSFALDPGITTMCFLYIVVWLLGFPDQAHGYAQAAEREVAQVTHVNTIANTSYILSAFALCCRDESLLERHANRLQIISKEHDLVGYQAAADLALGTLLALRGHESGNEQFQQGFDSRMARGVRMFMPNYVISHARALFGLKNLAAARNKVGVARELLLATGQRWTEPEIDRVDGDVCLAEGNPDDGVACYKHAITIAREQKAKSLELRAAVSLARYWVNRGERGMALDLLQPIYAEFTEGSGTPDLKEAMALLANLE